ncbi:hypothetical protein BJY01DRAFT_175639 [Aspergillus pseudoustus]|uniref:FAD-binding domain-containing protein n=1 Tax=Aspergillus pseudoustus TaxID=1810923 RepID=A0ABR4K261_9EURO
MSNKQFTVAIIGGGIGGLSLAAGLLRRNVPVTIYEAAAEFKEIGLGLTIGPAAHRAMPLLDPVIRSIYDELITTHADSPGYEAFKQTWFEVVWATGEKTGDLLMDLKARPSGQTTVRRADFLDALVRLIPEGVARFGKRLVELRERSESESEDGDDDHRMSMTFEDGTTAQASVVIGCDGIHSRVKQFTLPEAEYTQKQPRYSGMYGYRAVLDMETMVEAVGERRARVATMYIGDGAYGITYPIQRAKKANVGIFPLHPEWDCESWVRPASREDMRRDLRHMGPLVNRLIERMPDPSQWAIFEHPHISTYTRERAVILGDAAHASTPHQGAGAGQAIEDALVLAELLGDEGVITSDHVVAAFQAYDAVRRPRSQRAVTSSAENGYLLCLRLPGVMDDEERIKQAMQERLHWLWDLDVEAHVAEARKVMLEKIEVQQGTST